MIVTGGAALLVVVLAILLMIGVLPFSPLVVGGLFLLLCLGLSGPYIVRRTP